jgi:hypothetical protein
VIDTEPVHDVVNQIPVILGQPFLATANALINCKTGSDENLIWEYDSGT